MMKVWKSSVCLVLLSALAPTAYAQQPVAPATPLPFATPVPITAQGGQPTHYIIVPVQGVNGEQMPAGVAQPPATLVPIQQSAVSAPAALNVAGAPVDEPVIHPEPALDTQSCQECSGHKGRFGTLLGYFGLGERCWAHHDEYGCSSLRSVLRFGLGSCRTYFGERCRPGPPIIPTPPGYSLPPGYWR